MGGTSPRRSHAGDGDAGGSAEGADGGLASSAAAAAALQAVVLGFGPESDAEDEDDTPDAGPGWKERAAGAALAAVTTWLGFLAGLLSAVANAVLSVTVQGVLVAGYPVYALTPAPVVSAVLKGLFRVGYYAYLTPLGRRWHLWALDSQSGSPPHTAKCETKRFSTCVVVTVPHSGDNYEFLLVDRATGEAAAVDPADPTAMLQCIERLGVRLTTVLTTHRHHDHAGGNLRMKGFFPGLRVYGCKRDSIPGMTHAVDGGDSVWVGETLVRVIAAPCHTTGHLLFAVYGTGKPAPPEEPARVADSTAVDAELGAERDRDVCEALFSGDTIFAGGVGGFFHGTAADMHRNLHKRVSHLPDDTQIFCGHEYTLDLLRFAAWAEPNNALLTARVYWAFAQRQRRAATIPTTLGLERKLNPYFRVHDRAYVDAIAHKFERAYGSPSIWARMGFGGRVASKQGRRKRDDDLEEAGDGVVPDVEAVECIERLQKLAGFHQSVSRHRGDPPPSSVRATKTIKMRNAGSQTEPSAIPGSQLLPLNSAAPGSPAGSPV